MDNRNLVIHADNLILDLLKTVDQILQHFVKSGFESLVANNLGLITSLMTFYIMILGYRFATHQLEMTLPVLMKHMMLLCAIYGLLINWDLFWQFFYNVFTNEPTHISKALVQTQGAYQAQDTATALNQVFYQGTQASLALFEQASLKSMMVFSYGIIVFAVTCLSTLYALGLLIYAKLAMGLMLFLAPIFLWCFLFSSTKRLFENWLQALINFALVPIVTCGILMLMLTLAESCLPGLLEQAKAGEITLTGILPYLVTSLISTFLLKQVLPLSASLTQGLVLEGLSGLNPILNRSYQASGLPFLRSQVSKWAQSTNNKGAS